MTTNTTLGLTALLLAAIAGSGTAQQPTNGSGKDSAAATTKASPDSGKKTIPTPISLFRPQEINHIRPADMRGVNVFESPKEDEVPYTGFVLSLGGAFTQEFQGLSHANTAAPVVVSGVNSNQLMTIGHGFNNAVANLNVNVQLAPGIRVAMTSYLSARHHQESWVKDGYVLMDASPIDNVLLKDIMKYATVKVGHFEINYGDSHFRRSDNGNSMFNPFVGNYVLDAFTTEIGAEVYARSDGVIAMLAATGGEIRGQVTAPSARSLSTIGKLGFDQRFGDQFRFRLTGSFYANNKAASNTLYTGDRGGSPYYDVLENTASTETANAWSGQVRPGFSNKVNAEVVNPFVKVGGAEFYGHFETATGGAFTEPKLRTLHQNVYEALYRFADDRLYLGGRYIRVNGELISKTYTDQTVNRTQLGGGWFVTPNTLAKLEWVTQKYLDFPTNDIRYGGQFKGFMVTGTIGF
jgi:hypothetical protein